MDGTFTLPGPHTLIVFGVHIKIFSAIFGIVGVFLGHLMAPIVEQALGPRRLAAVLAADVLLAIAITIATGQRPLTVLGWSIGIGFAGITIFQGWSERARAAAVAIGSTAMDELTERVAAHKDRS